MPSHKDLTLNDLSYMPVNPGPPSFYDFHGYLPSQPPSYAAYHGSKNEFGYGVPGAIRDLGQSAFFPGTIPGNQSPVASWMRSGLPAAAKSAAWNAINQGGFTMNALGNLAEGYWDAVPGPLLGAASDVASYAWNGPNGPPPVTPSRIQARTDTAPNTAQNVQAPTSMPVQPTDPVLVDPTTPQRTSINSAHEAVTPVDLARYGINESGTSDDWNDAFRSLVDPKEQLQEQLDPEYMELRKDRQNREWSASYEVSKARENYEYANRVAKNLASGSSPNPHRLAVAMHNLEFAEQQLVGAQKSEYDAMAIGTQQDENRQVRAMEQKKINATIQAAQIKAGQGDGRDLEQFHTMAYNALVAGGIDAERAKSFAPTVLKMTSEGVEVNPEMMKMYFGLNDKDAVAVANAMSNLFGTMSNDPEFKGFRSKFVASNTPLTEFEQSVIDDQKRIREAKNASRGSAMTMQMENR